MHRKQVRRPAKQSRKIVRSRKADNARIFIRLILIVCMAGYMRRQLACICILGISVLPLAAQEAGRDTIAGKVHEIEKVVVTARRLPNKVTSAVPVQTMSKQEMERLGIQGMADAVRRFAGANVKDYGGIGGLKTVSIRSMGAPHTAVSYDGVAVSNCLAGQIDIGRFSTDNVAMLSLAVGQGEDLLQSARLYASAGVLNIETEKPHLEEGRNTAFRVRMKGGSFGYVSPSLRWWQRVGDRTHLAVNADYMRADGVYPFTLVNGKYVTKEKRHNSAIYSWQGEAALYHTFGDGGELDVKGGYYYSRRGLPGAVTLYNPLSDETLWDENPFVQARYKKRFSPRWSVQAQAKYTHGWNLYEDKGKEYEQGVYRGVHRQDEYYLSATALYSPSLAWSLSVAQDGAVNKLRSNLNDCPFPTRYTSLTAFNVRYRQGAVTATGTLVHTFVTERVKVGEAPDDFQRLAPSLSISLKPWKEEELFLRLMYKSTFRMPTFNDLYYYRLGNRSLRPEKANEYNVGITWSRSAWRLPDYLSVTVDAYYNDVTDKIVAFPTTYAWRMANYGKVRAVGVDITLATAVALGRSMKLAMSGGYSYQKAVDVTDATAKNYKEQLPYTPVHTGNVSAVWETPWLNMGYSVVGVGKRYRLSQNIPENRIDGYMEHTVSVSRELAMKRCKLRLQAEVVNLTDEQYEVIKYYPMPGRSWRLTGTLNF